MARIPIVGKLASCVWCSPANLVLYSWYLSRMCAYDDMYCIICYSSDSWVGRQCASLLNVEKSSVRSAFWILLKLTCVLFSSFIYMIIYIYLYLLYLCYYWHIYIYIIYTHFLYVTQINVICGSMFSCVLVKKRGGCMDLRQEGGWRTGDTVQPTYPHSTYTPTYYLLHRNYIGGVWKRPRLCNCRFLTTQLYWQYRYRVLTWHLPQSGDQWLDRLQLW